MTLLHNQRNHVAQNGHFLHISIPEAVLVCILLQASDRRAILSKVSAELELEGLVSLLLLLRRGESVGL